MTVKEFYRRADFSGGFDREIDLWKIIDIHEIPKVMLEQYEVDFYCFESCFCCNYVDV